MSPVSMAGVYLCLLVVSSFLTFFRVAVATM